MYYERFIELCEKNGEKPTPVIQKLGLSRDNLKQCKQGAALNSDILCRVANYFDVSVDYLLGRTTSAVETRGKVFKYGDNIDTDVIIPARYLNISDFKELALHCMEDVDREFIKKVRRGDIIAAGSNFGCGSSREHAPIVIKESGVSCVIAVSFARIFYRNAINIGLPILECLEVEDIKNGDELSINFETGEINNITRNKSYKAEGFPDFIRQIIEAGGLLNSIKKK